MDDTRTKKEGLTLAQLASYDDFITDALVDKVYFWSTIRKNRSRYSASRYLHDEEIARILQESVIIEKDVGQACTKLLALPGVRRYLDRLKDYEQEHFKRHFRKYVDMYMPDCAFEVNTTNRYTIVTQEAAAIARKQVKKGELIKYLSGIQVSITKEEEKDLDLTRRDFSIVMSSRKRTPSLFLGPARFANHDCDANARLSTIGAHGMAIYAAKDIDIGDEITVTYGEDYFGIDNCECLCATCEGLKRNGWDPARQKDADDEGSDVVESQSSSGRGRPNSRSATTSRHSTPMNSDSRERKCDSLQPNDTPTKHHLPDRPHSPVHKHSPSGLRREVLVEELQPNGLLDPTPARSDSPGSVFGNSQKRSNISTATSMSGHDLETHAKASRFEEEVTTTSIWSMPPPKILISVESSGPESTDRDRSDSDLSSLDDGLEADDSSKQVISRKAQRMARLTRAALARSPHRSSSSTPIVHDPNVLEDDPDIRRPGDYLLTRRLLATPYSRWVKCLTKRYRRCNQFFVQIDAYQTRRSCPRCERHSKLYGYEWPKTDKESKSDMEERITDHRLVNRFVHADIERAIRKGKKTVADLVREEAERRERGSDWESSEEEAEEEEQRPLKRKRLMEGNGSRKRLINNARIARPVHRPAKKHSTSMQQLIKAAAERSQRPAYNADGTIRFKRKYTWSGKYVGRWRKSHPEAESPARKFSTTSKSSTARPSSKQSDQLRAKRTYVRSGKYIGRHRDRIFKRMLEGKVSESQARLYFGEHLTDPTRKPSKDLVENMPLKTNHNGKNDSGNNSAKKKEKRATPTKPAAPKPKAKKAPGWKGWACIDENGNEISPPSSPKERVLRAHPTPSRGDVRLDINPEKAATTAVRNTSTRSRSRSTTTPNAVRSTKPARDAVSTGKQKKRAKGWLYLDTDSEEEEPQSRKATPPPKRVKGWVYLDDDDNPLPEHGVDQPLSTRSSRTRSGAATTSNPDAMVIDSDVDQPMTTRSSRARQAKVVETPKAKRRYVKSGFYSKKSTPIQREHSNDSITRRSHRHSMPTRRADWEGYEGSTTPEKPSIRAQVKSAEPESKVVASAPETFRSASSIREENSRRWRRTVLIGEDDDMLDYMAQSKPEIEKPEFEPHAAQDVEESEDEDEGEESSEESGEEDDEQDEDYADAGEHTDLDDGDEDYLDIKREVDASPAPKGHLFSKRKRVITTSSDEESVDDSMGRGLRRKRARVTM